MRKDKKVQTALLSPIVTEGDFKVEFREDHVYVYVGPDYKVNAGQRTEFWDKVLTTSELNNTQRILIEGYRPKGELTTTDVIEAGQLASAKPHLWIAFCLDELFPDELRELFEVVVASRLVRAKFFTDHQQAIVWLRNNAPA